ncbi:hypothetical protein BCR44DRAFT_253899 [Catenaria anguillulae PL171]|uniref:Uncharacterized protein n=1 Tax=Catenaria anguillulae PL171 TaxID=765915 RepID=A0A1Y2I1F6_9FUNG|nr:hypothetical protein BCR44DRAFT_253899 [Catenaria anguillulae PL171]
MSGLFRLASSLADPTVEMHTPGHLPSLGQFTPDPHLALQTFHSTLTGHFSSGGGSNGPRSRIEYATHMAMAFFEPHLTEAKAYFDAVAHDLTPVFPHLVPVDYAARVVAETECRASQLLVPWFGAGSGSAVPAALALEASLGMALAGVAPSSNVCLVIRAALIATACACSRDIVASPESWTFPYDPPVSYGGPSEQELDVRRDLLLRDILSAASGSPFPRRLLPAVAALTGRQLIAILGRSKCTSFTTSAGIPNSSLPHSAQPALVQRLPHVPKPYPLYVSLVPWTARNSGHEQHAYLLNAMDDAAYFGACTYPVCMYRVCEQAVATFMVGAQERRRERVRRRDADDEGERNLGMDAAEADAMMVVDGAGTASQEAAARVAATGNPFGFVPSVLSASSSRAGSAPGTPENGRKRVRTLQPDEQ